MKYAEFEKEFDYWYDTHFPADKGNWYVMRATYGRAFKLSHMKFEGCQFFVPTFKVRKIVHGKPKYVQNQYLDNLLYVFADAESIEKLAQDKRDFGYVNYYYDHFGDAISSLENSEKRKLKAPVVKKPVIVVDHETMRSFMKLAKAQSEDKHLVREDLVHYRNGDLVEVLEGPFKGVVGRIARVMGQQRVVVDNGVCIAVTSYIATPLLRVIEKNKFS